MLQPEKSTCVSLPHPGPSAWNNILLPLTLSLPHPFFGPLFLSFKTAEESLHPLFQPTAKQGRVHLLGASVALTKLRVIVFPLTCLLQWPMKSRTACVLHLSIPLYHLLHWLIHNKDSIKALAEWNDSLSQARKVMVTHHSQETLYLQINICPHREFVLNMPPNQTWPIDFSISSTLASLMTPGVLGGCRISISHK